MYMHSPQAFRAFQSQWRKDSASVPSPLPSNCPTQHASLWSLHIATEGFPLPAGPGFCFSSSNTSVVIRC